MSTMNPPILVNNVAIPAQTEVMTRESSVPVTSVWPVRPGHPPYRTNLPVMTMPLTTTGDTPPADALGAVADPHTALPS